MFKVLLCLVATFFLGAHALVGTECLTEAECDEGECCQILSEFLVVSKRDVRQEPTTSASTTPDIKKGTCQPYRFEGSYCGVFEKINGYCGCAPGLECISYEIPVSTVSPSVARNARSPPMPRPGFKWVSDCQKV